MSSSREDLYKAALALDESERVALVGMLLKSLDTEVEEGVEAAWAKEIERRVRELDAGAVKPIPWEDVRASLHHKPSAPD